MHCRREASWANRRPASLRASDRNILKPLYLPKKHRDTKFVPFKTSPILILQSYTIPFYRAKIICTGMFTNPRSVQYRGKERLD